MFEGWFPRTTEPSDFSTAEPPFNINAVLVSPRSIEDFLVIKLFQLAAFFVVPYLAFLIVLPGVRDKRLVSLITFTVTVFVGGALTGHFCYCLSHIFKACLKGA